MCTSNFQVIATFQFGPPPDCISNITGAPRRPPQSAFWSMHGIPPGASQMHSAGKLKHLPPRLQGRQVTNTNVFCCVRPGTLSTIRDLRRAHVVYNDLSARIRLVGTRDRIKMAASVTHQRPIRQILVCKWVKRVAVEKL